MRRLATLFTFGRILWLLIIGIFLNVIYIAYLRFYPFETIEVYNEPFPVLNQPVRAGDPLIYEVDYCRFTDVPAHSSRTLIGPTLITISETDSSTDIGCRKLKVTNAVIPSYAPPGTYYMKIDACYLVNPLKNICHDLRTEEFEVIKQENQ